MKLQLSRDGDVVEIGSIHTAAGEVFFGGRGESDAAFMAYPNSGAGRIDFLANRNFSLIIELLKKEHVGVFIDEKWVAEQIDGCVFLKKRPPHLYICSECDSILGLVDCFKEDGFSKTFLKPCEKCIEDALESEPDRHSESAGF